MSVSPAPPPSSPGRARGGALHVAAGILASRLVGLLRERVFAHYLGSSVAAAAFRGAIRIPNVLQNLLGEGVLSASFIPSYARLLGEGKTDEARELAGAIFGVLAALVAMLSAVGVLFAPVLADVLVPGFHGEARILCIDLIRILFPSTALL